jgi:long-subunit acyl-CoA synthetase (AMP-forming)
MTSTLCEAFQETAARDPEAVALRSLDGSIELTWADYAREVQELAAGLTGLGVKRGDTVAMLLPNCPQFHLIDVAAMHVGATPFSIYNTLSPEQIAYLFENAQPPVVITDASGIDRVTAVAGDRHVLVLEDGLDALKAAAPAEFDFEASWRAVEPDDVATLIYTSGTTGPPKGVQLTHANLLAQCYAVAEVLDLRFGDRITSYLPSAHIADRWSSHYNGIVFGVQVTSVPDPRAIAQALPAVKPTIWGGVPRVYEKIKAALEAGGVTDPSALPDEAKAGVRAKLGLDEARWMIVGAAPLSRDVHEFFLQLGFPLVELYGMSEAACVITVAKPGEDKIGTVGPAIPGLELRLADDGELLARGATIMAGYRNDPEKTAEAIDADGWLHTGDIATIDDDGHVTIVDRKKEIIINAAGKNMSPANIEQVVKGAHPLIGQVAVVGDRRPYNVALLVLDPDAAAGRSATDEDVQREVADAVAAANERLSRVEQIKKYELLDEEWLPGGEELTPTMKLKRKPIDAKYADVIEGLYA